MYVLTATWRRPDGRVASISSGSGPAMRTRARLARLKEDSSCGACAFSDDSGVCAATADTISP